MVFSYKQSYDKSISDNLKKRFQDNISVLEKQGFSYFSMHQEAIWPFSVIFLFPVYLMMAANEYVQIESPSRVTSYHLMYSSQEYSTIAYVYGMGCKFFTKFTDGTWVVSNTGQKIRDEKILILKPEPGMNFYLLYPHPEKENKWGVSKWKVGERTKFAGHETTNFKCTCVEDGFPYKKGDALHLNRTHMVKADPQGDWRLPDDEPDHKHAGNTISPMGQEGVEPEQGYLRVNC